MYTDCLEEISGELGFGVLVSDAVGPVNSTPARHVIIARGLAELMTKED